MSQTQTDRCAVHSDDASILREPVRIDAFTMRRGPVVHRR